MKTLFLSLSMLLWLSISTAQIKELKNFIQKDTTIKLDDDKGTELVGKELIFDKYISDFKYDSINKVFDLVVNKYKKPILNEKVIYYPKGKFIMYNIASKNVIFHTNYDKQLESSFVKDGLHACGGLTYDAYKFYKKDIGSKIGICQIINPLNGTVESKIKGSIYYYSKEQNTILYYPMGLIHLPKVGFVDKDNNVFEF